MAARGGLCARRALCRRLCLLPPAQPCLAAAGGPGRGHRRQPVAGRPHVDSRRAARMGADPDRNRDRRGGAVDARDCVWARLVFARPEDAASRRPGAGSRRGPGRGERKAPIDLARLDCARPPKPEVALDPLAGASPVGLGSDPGSRCCPAQPRRAAFRPGEPPGLGARTGGRGRRGRRGGGGGRAGAGRPQAPFRAPPAPLQRRLRAAVPQPAGGPAGGRPRHHERGGDRIERHGARKRAQRFRRAGRDHQCAAGSGGHPL